MLYEINQIQKWLAKKFHLKMKKGGGVHGKVPDGKYRIPLGVSETKTTVTIKDGKIHILLDD